MILFAFWVIFMILPLFFHQNSLYDLKPCSQLSFIHTALTACQRFQAHPFLIYTHSLLLIFRQVFWIEKVCVLPLLLFLCSPFRVFFSSFFVGGCVFCLHSAVPTQTYVLPLCCVLFWFVIFFFFFYLDFNFMYYLCVLYSHPTSLKQFWDWLLCHWSWHW